MKIDRYTVYFTKMACGEQPPLYVIDDFICYDVGFWDKLPAEYYYEGDLHDAKDSPVLTPVSLLKPGAAEEEWNREHITHLVLEKRTFEDGVIVEREILRESEGLIYGVNPKIAREWKFICWGVGIFLLFLVVLCINLFAIPAIFSTFVVIWIVGCFLGLITGHKM